MSALGTLAPIMSWRMLPNETVLAEGIIRQKQKHLTESEIHRKVNNSDTRIIYVSSRFVWIYTCIREVVHSNLGRSSGYAYWSLPWFSPIPPGKCRDNTSFGSWPFPSIFFPVHYLQIILPFDGIYFEIPRAARNKPQKIFMILYFSTFLKCDKLKYNSASHGTPNHTGIVCI
jgi:hypothetical protein